MKILILFILLAALLVPALGAGDPVNIGDISAPYLSPGETGVLKVTVVNVGENPLKGVRASLDPNTDGVPSYSSRSYQEENPVMPVGSPQYYLGYIPQNENRDAYFNIAAQPGISPGTYLVAVVLEYTIGDTTSIARKVVGITVGLTPRSVLDLNEVRLDPPNPSPGQVVNLTLAIVNRKDTLIKDLVVTLGAEQKKTSGGLFSQPEKSPGTTIVPLGVSSKALGGLAPGARAQVEYQLAISNKAEQGPYLVKVLLSYLDQGNMEQNINREFGLLVSGQPRLDVYPGEAKTSSSETKAKIKVTNSGAGEARDVRLRVQENEYFYSKKEAFVAGVLGKDDSVDVEAEFYFKAKGEGSYPILIGITYQDPSGKIVEKQLAQQVYMGEPPGIRGLLILFAIFAFIFYLVNRKYKLIRSEILDLLWKKIPRPKKKSQYLR